MWLLILYDAPMNKMIDAILAQPGETRTRDEVMRDIRHDSHAKANAVLLMRALGVEENYVELQKSLLTEIETGGITAPSIASLVLEDLRKLLWIDEGMSPDVTRRLGLTVDGNKVAKES